MKDKKHWIIFICLSIFQVTVAGFALLSPSWSFQLSDISPDFVSHLYYPFTKVSGSVSV